jgi:nucleoid-associated protein YgaU
MLSRKDVKLGLAIGGILLAVVVVYLMSSPGSKPAVILAKNDSSTNADVHEPGAGQAADASTPAASQGSGPASETQGGGAAPAPDAAPAGAPAVAAAGSVSSAAANDPWDSALRTGKLPAMMSSTPAATGASAAPGGSGDTVAQSPIAVGSAAPSASGAGDANKEIALNTGPTTEPGAQTGSEAAATTARVHVVKPGETLCTIAAAAWGRSSLYDNLIRANPGIDPRHLHVGMKINIPVLDTAKPSRGEAGSGASAAQSSMGDGEPTGAAAGGGVITPSHYVAGAPARAELAAEQTAHSGIAPDGKTYVVVSSDSLYRISKRLYGSIKETNQIYELNKAIIGADMARLKVGMVLKLPEAPTNLAKAG